MGSYVKAQVGDGAMTLAALWYVSSEIFAAERERIFAREWICVGRTEQLEAAGDYFVATVAGESLIVTRDASGELRALYNVCRHRGTRMCDQGSRTFRRLDPMPVSRVDLRARRRAESCA